MTENFKILTEFVKDISSETPDVETYIFVKDTISKYHLDIAIASKPLKIKFKFIVSIFIPPIHILAEIISWQKRRKNGDKVTRSSIKPKIKKINIAMKLFIKRGWNNIWELFWNK